MPHRLFQQSRSVFLLLLAGGLAAPQLTFALDHRDQLSQYSRQTWQTENGLPQNTVRTMVQTRDGYLWLGTDGGLVRFDGIKFTVFDAENTPELKSNNIRAIIEDGRGFLWIGTPEALSCWTGSGFLTYTTQHGLPANNILSLQLDSQGNLEAETSEGIAAFNGNGFERTTSANPAGSTNQIRYRDREGSTWIGGDQGALRIADGVTQSFPENDPLSRDTVLSFLEDREGNLWVGTESSGLTVLRNQVFSMQAGRDESNRPIRCVLQDRSETVWVGTSGEGLRRLSSGKTTVLTTAEGLASNIILSLAEDKRGDLWVGTPDGLNRISKGRISLWTAANGLAEDFIRSLYADDDGSLWIGTRRGLSHLKDNGVTTYTQSNGLGSDLVGALARMKDGDLWIGTLGGLSRFHGGRFSNLTTREGLSSNVITDLYFDKENTLWIGTQGGGLNRWRNGSFTNFSPQLGLPAIIYGVTEDTEGGLWLAARNGIFRIRKEELATFDQHAPHKLNVVSYGTNDGLRVSECSGGGHPAIWNNQAGTIWFSTAKGVAVLTPRAGRLNRLPPPVALEAVVVDDKTYNPALITDIRPSYSRLSFEYAGLSFVAPQKVRFRYKLEGFDRDWIDAGSRRVAYYTNVPAGKYRFHVLARNNDGLWNEQGALLPLRILPHYYQTWWFILLLSASVFLLGYIGYRWRVRQVQARFGAILQERNRIAREIHDTLAQGFVGVSVQLEIVARLMTSSMDAAREHLDQARSQVRHSLADARQAIWELRSQSAEYQDFAARISKMAAQITESSSVKAQVQVRGIYRPLSARVEEELFRIGQEAVTNAVRHANAQVIQIELNFTAKKLHMSVIDDGSGFADNANTMGPNGHFGLKGMRERAQQINGDLVVSSAIGEGTRITVEVAAR